MKNPVRFVYILLLFGLLVISPVPAQTPSGFSSWFGDRTEVGVGLGFGKFKANVINGNQMTLKNNEVIFTGQTINGIKIANRAFLGLGLGYELWQHGSFVPVFGYLSYDLQKKENPFVASVSLGYSYGSRKGTSEKLDTLNMTTGYYNGKGGFMASIGLGYRQKISKKLSFAYEIFYQYQVIQSSYYSIVTDSIGRVKHSTSSDYQFPNHFIGFRIGIVY
jgi:hypothetical protein